jgi:hypothetical protein
MRWGPFGAPLTEPIVKKHGGYNRNDISFDQRSKSMILRYYLDNLFITKAYAGDTHVCLTLIKPSSFHSFHVPPVSTVGSLI